jgi:general secretion pathway protein H
MTWRSDRRAGFTLIELLIVLAIMAAASVWFMTYLRTGSTGAKLRAATRELEAALDETRSLAIAEDRVTAVVVDASARIYREPHGVHHVASGLALVVPDGGGAIYFFPDGSSSGGEIAFATGHASEAVSVDWLTGRAQAHALQTGPR